VIAMLNMSNITQRLFLSNGLREQGKLEKLNQCSNSYQTLPMELNKLIKRYQLRT
jgi:hypothetical protein